MRKTLKYVSLAFSRSGSEPFISGIQFWNVYAAPKSSVSLPGCKDIHPAAHTTLCYVSVPC